MNSYLVIRCTFSSFLRNEIFGLWIFFYHINTTATVEQEVYEQQKELILLGERAVLATLGFDLNVQHPYKPLVEAIKKFKVAQNALAQVAWNFVNDGYVVSLIYTVPV